MDIEEYYKAVTALEAPANLDLEAKVIWFQNEINLLRNRLSKEDLLAVLKKDKQWQKKVDSSIS